MIYTASTKKIIREMDSTELEDFLRDKWINIYRKNTGAMFMTGANALSEIMLCSQCYKQLTGNLIFTNISEEFTCDFNQLKKSAI